MRQVNRQGQPRAIPNPGTQAGSEQAKGAVLWVTFLVPAKTEGADLLPAGWLSRVFLPDLASGQLGSWSDVAVQPQRPREMSLLSSRIGSPAIVVPALPRGWRTSVRPPQLSGARGVRSLGRGGTIEHSS
jgi:hypothetical protein